METDRHRWRQCHVVGGRSCKPRDAKESQQPPGARREAGSSSSHSPQEKLTASSWTPDLRLQNCERTRVCCVKTPLCGPLLEQPQETNTVSCLPPRTRTQVLLPTGACQPVPCTYRPSAPASLRQAASSSASQLRSEFCGQGPRPRSSLYPQLLEHTMNVERMEE